MKKCKVGIVFLTCVVQGVGDLLKGTLMIIIAPDPRN